MWNITILISVILLIPYGHGVALDNKYSYKISVVLNNGLELQNLTEF